MTLLKKRKNIGGDRQLNIKKFSCQILEPRKTDEGRVTEATSEKMTGAGERGQIAVERGAARGPLLPLTPVRLPTPIRRVTAGPDRLVTLTQQKKKYS